MRRSEINSILADAVDFFETMKIALPVFAFYSIDDWRRQRRSVREILDLQLGWDITDFGAGDFSKTGLLLFTLRNGKLRSRLYPKPYAEKIMIVGEGQVTPMHFHWKKMEDIINRGGGNLMIELHRSTADEGLSAQHVTVSIDGTKRVLSAGSALRLTPGQSITLPQGLYHRFYGEPGYGKVIVGEVSMVNDDTTDNRFFDLNGRFPAIDEDTTPTYLLCTDYDTFIR